ncbi:MAG TPA: nucleotide exchange factor GrpE [Planctomycetes bacterium]|nr:nucleotide exchange factor GrpE [Planctomycetota bacterium]
MASKRSKKKRQEEEAAKTAVETPETSQPEASEAAEPDASPPADSDAHAELTTRLQRAVADLQNYRKQTEKRIHETRRFTKRDLFRELLPIVDTFKAALAAAEQGQDPESVLVGVKMIHDMLVKFLGDHGVEPIESKGKPFDPNYHEAVTSVPSEDHPPGAVVEEMQPGWKMDDLVVRHSKVIVASPPQESAEACDDAEANNDDTKNGED